MICPSCGKQFSEGDLFCASCGAPAPGTERRDEVTVRNVPGRNKQLIGMGVFFVSFLVALHAYSAIDNTWIVFLIASALGAAIYLAGFYEQRRHAK
ncbi:MAG: hypothetical protein CXZ00_02225 [Acidobacteria bacterium]|nr:MAG: hypothetical protein CXZ00_02225 [Acidobacteriota bacterium]